MQKPDATLVAGYQAWQKQHQRHVRKGEKGIQIIAPSPYKAKKEREVLDPATGRPKLDAQANVIRRFFVRICGAMFRVASWYLHIGGNYHKYPAGMVKNSLRDFSPDAGFEYRMPEKTNPAVARFDIISCPYYTMCKKYNCLELNAAFCDCDDAKYGNLHRNLKWARTGTIGKGASCCDFRIIDISRCPDYED